MATSHQQPSLKDQLLGILGMLVLIGVISLINVAATWAFGDSTYFWRIAIVSGALLVLAVLLDGDVYSLVRGWNIGYTAMGLVICILGVEETFNRTWSVTLPLLAVLIALRWLHARDYTLAKALAGTLEPTAIGLMISLVLVTLFSLFGATVPFVWMVEKWIAGAATFASGGIEKVGWLEFSSILILLVIVNAWLPGWRPVSGLLRIKSGVEKTAAVLAVLSSISFVAGSAAAGLVNDEVQRRRSQYQAAWEREKKAETEARLIPQVEQAWRAASLAERRSIVAFARLAGEAGSEVRARVLENVIRSENNKSSRPEPPAAPGIDAIGARPGGLQEARDEPAIMARQVQKATAAENAREERWKAAESIFSEGLVALVPAVGPDSVMGFVKAFVSIDAERFFTANIRPLLEKTDWIPAYWKPAVYDVKTGRSSLTESVRREVIVEREQAAERVRAAAIERQRVEMERRVAEEARPAEHGIP